jgi:hypothetical protein
MSSQVCRQCRVKQAIAAATPQASSCHTSSSSNACGSQVPSHILHLMGCYLPLPLPCSV